MRAPVQAEIIVPKMICDSDNLLLVSSSCAESRAPSQLKARFVLFFHLGSRMLLGCGCDLGEELSILIAPRKPVGCALGKTLIGLSTGN